MRNSSPFRGTDRSASRAPNRVHLLAHANPLEPDLARFGFGSVEEYVEFARTNLPPPLRITCDLRVLKAVEAPWHGGRTDDAARIRDVQGALADPRTLALVALSGGAYFSRLLPHIDFDILRERRTPLWALGFSEMTTLLAHISIYRCGRSLYWLCPNWLGARIKPESDARAALAEFWRTLPTVFGFPALRAPSASEGSNPAAANLGIKNPSASEGSPSHSAHLHFGPIVGQLALGRLRGPTGRPASVGLIGGCLSVLAAAIGGPLGRRLRPDGKWLILEDIKESPYRIDRHLAALKLAGWFERVAGIIVGDFRMLNEDTQPAVLELLKYHLPRAANLPVVITRSFGHIWPMVPVLLNRAVPVSIRGSTVEFG